MHIRPFRPCPLDRCGRRLKITGHRDLPAFMADSLVPWGVDALGGPVTDPAWRVKPSWYLVTGYSRQPEPVQGAPSASKVDAGAGGT